MAWPESPPSSSRVRAYQLAVPGMTPAPRGALPPMVPLHVPDIAQADTLFIREFWKWRAGEVSTWSSAHAGLPRSLGAGFRPVFQSPARPGDGASRHRCILGYCV